MVACTVALVLDAALAPAIDRFASRPWTCARRAPRRVGLATPVGAALALLVPAVAIVAVLFRLLASERLPARLLPLTLGYLAGLPFALVYPPVAIGTVGGTAAGTRGARPARARRSRSPWSRWRSSRPSALRSRGSQPGPDAPIAVPPL